MKKAILSISHTNYMLRSAGTERYIRELSKLFQESQYTYVNVFSFYDDKKMLREKMLGLNINDQFKGIYKYRDMDKVVDMLNWRYGLTITAIHIQHLINHDLDSIKDIINSLRVPVFYFMHDYFNICIRQNLIDSSNAFCGTGAPSNEKCQSCAYMKQGIQHHSQMQSFFGSINEYLTRVVCPSEYVAKVFIENYPQYRERVTVRPHLNYALKDTVPEISGKIRIAYAGGQNLIKGYPAWTELVNACKACDQYEFYYFGTGKDQLDGVRNVFVSTAAQGDDAMKNALGEHKIDCAFLWPSWPETYSYVLYELMENDIFVITNNISGNIYDVVSNHENGKCFSELAEVKDWMSNPDQVRAEINQYRTKNSFHIKDVTGNRDIQSISPDGTMECTEKKTIGKRKKVGIDPLMTLMYMAKYKRELDKK